MGWLLFQDVCNSTAKRQTIISGIRNALRQASERQASLQ
jgi:hypothetical protein